MRTALVLLAGIVLGCTLMLGAVLLSGGWYEYHLLDASAKEDPVPMVNRGGWELMPMGQLRRPRVRLH